MMNAASASARIRLIRIRTFAFVLRGVALWAGVLTAASGATPALGRSPRYCNPLPMVSGSGTAASGDVTVIRDSGKYYM